jgi:hypothetical protein
LRPPDSRHTRTPSNLRRLRTGWTGPGVGLAKETGGEIIRECVLGPVTDEKRTRSDARRRARELPNLSWRAIATMLGNRRESHTSCQKHPTPDVSDPLTARSAATVRPISCTGSSRPDGRISRGTAPTSASRSPRQFGGIISTVGHHFNGAAVKPECTDELMCQLRVSLWRCDAGMGVGDRPTSVSGCSTGFFILWSGRKVSVRR